MTKRVVKDFLELRKKEGQWWRVLDTLPSKITEAENALASAKKGVRQAEAVLAKAVEGLGEARKHAENARDSLLLGRKTLKEAQQGLDELVKRERLLGLRRTSPRVPPEIPEDVAEW